MTTENGKKKLSISEWISIGVVVAATLLGGWITHKLEASQKAQAQISSTLDKLDDRSLSTQKDFMYLANKVDKIDIQFQTFNANMANVKEKVESVRNESYTKLEVMQMIDKLENTTNSRLTRIGNVMYGDRQELANKIQQNSSDIQYLYGKYNISNPHTKNIRDPYAKTTKLDNDSAY